MADPAHIQTLALAATAGVTTYTRNFAAQLAAGSGVIALAVCASPAATPVPVASVKAVKYDGDPGSGGVLTGEEVTLVAQIGQNWAFEERKELGQFLGRVTSAGWWGIKVTSSQASSNITLGGIEISLPASYSVTVNSAGSANGVTAHSAGSAPESGTLPEDSGFVVNFTSGTDGPANIGWPAAPTNWTKHSDVNDGTSGKQTAAAYYRSFTGSDAAISQTITTSAAATYGRVSAIMVIQETTPQVQTQQYIKVTNEDDSVDGITGISVDVHRNPATGEKGPRIFTASAQSFSTIEGGKSVMLIPVPDTSAFENDQTALSVDDTVIVTGGLPDDSGGFVRRAIGVVVEIIE